MCKTVGSLQVEVHKRVGSLQVEVNKRVGSLQVEVYTCIKGWGVIKLRYIKR